MAMYVGTRPLCRKEHRPTSLWRAEERFEAAGEEMERPPVAGAFCSAERCIHTAAL